MKSPFLIFLPAALGAAGIYLLVQPGQREELLPDPGAADVHRSGANPPSERDWGGMWQGRDGGGGGESPAARPPVDASRLASTRRSLRNREMVPAPPARGAADSRPGGKARHSRGDLERRAAQVEIEANRELERLIPVLGLSEAQQQRIFAVLVRHSSAFDPVMRVETAGETVFPEDETYAGATKDEELYTALEPHQQAVMEEMYEDQAAWWQDVVEQLVPDAAIPGLGGDEPPMMADEKPVGESGAGKDVTGSVRPPSP